MQTRRAWEIQMTRGAGLRRVRWLILKIEFLLHLLGYEITKSKAQNFQMSVTWDKCQKCVRMLRYITYSSSILNGSAHLEMCLGSACPQGQKTLCVDRKQLCLNLLASTARAKSQRPAPHVCISIFMQMLLSKVNSHLFIFQFEFCIVIICNWNRHGQPTTLHHTPPLSSCHWLKRMTESTA